MFQVSIELLWAEMRWGEEGRCEVQGFLVDMEITSMINESPLEEFTR